MTTWKEKIDKLATADDFNKMLTGQDKPDELVKGNVKRMLSSAAKKKGLTFDSQAGKFVSLVRGEAA